MIVFFPNKNETRNIIISGEGSFQCITPNNSHADDLTSIYSRFYRSEGRRSRERVWKHEFEKTLQAHCLVFITSRQFCNTTSTVLSVPMNYEIRLFLSPLNIYTASLHILATTKWAVKTVVICSDSDFFFLPWHHLELKNLSASPQQTLDHLVQACDIRST